MSEQKTVTLSGEQRQLLQLYRENMQEELRSILAWWLRYARDEKQGGCFGKVDNDNIPDVTAPKGLVLHSRVLWTFSAAGLLTGDKLWKQEADRVYEYLISRFEDAEYGGMYWSVNADGTIAVDKKQVYGQAFAIYGLVEYYKLTRKQEALNKAIDLFYLLEKYAHDAEYGGYIEALSRTWGNVADVRLSEKELNVSKTMNTHLHVAEAFASLYTAWKDPLLEMRLEELAGLFYIQIIDKENLQQRLFFSMHWEPEPSVISFGHDIEAAWLLQECAGALQKKEWQSIYNSYAVKMAAKVLPATDKDGGLWYEYDPQQQRWIKEKHWWPQAEAMVGFFNAWQESGEDKFLQQSWQSWQFVQSKLKVPGTGEWYWGIDAKGAPMQKQDKAGFWKCPYHNGRACIELIRRISAYVS
ncbi:MAG TPA: AGE family epimerase/isomerase [Chitinophagaceae bacterium]|nr:AGE family epimerase/isomerase [Chitinophagaceae bacterium]